MPEPEAYGLLTIQGRHLELAVFVRADAVDTLLKVLASIDREGEPRPHDLWLDHLRAEVTAMPDADVAGHLAGVVDDLARQCDQQSEQIGAASELVARVAADVKAATEGERFESGAERADRWALLIREELAGLRRDPEAREFRDCRSWPAEVVALAEGVALPAFLERWRADG